MNARLRPLAEVLERSTGEIFDQVVEDLQCAVRTPSVNPLAEGGRGEGAVQNWFARVLDSLGCRVQMVDVDADALADAYPIIRPFLGRSFQGRPNVVGWLDGIEDEAPVAGDGGRKARLLLNSHADTVAPVDAAAWSVPPLGAVIDGDAIWGLGAADAKGSLVTFLGALRAIRTAGLRLRRGLMIQSVVDEEAGGAGALDLIRRGYTAEAAVIGEPTQMHICPGSRGAQDLYLELQGRRAHPGEGWRGVNAAHKARLYIDALERLREELDTTEMHPLWRPLHMGHVWNLMAVNTGPSNRAVPGRCRVEYSIGTIGVERPGHMRAKVEAALAAVTKGDAWLREHPPAVSWSSWVLEPAVTPAEHDAVAMMADAGRALGEEVRVEALSAATDGRYLNNVAGLPTINFGPGQMFRGHSPDEWLPLDQLHRSVAWMALFITAWCGTTGGAS